MAAGPIIETVAHSLHLGEAALDRARLSRDARFDGAFFIAVVTTGIYCRPICPARTPKKANIRYYFTAAAAEEAGFRPCLRCRPEAAPGSPAWRGTSAVVKRALDLIAEGFLDTASVSDLAERAGIGARHLHRLFLQHAGASPLAVAQTRRLHFAKRLLNETHLPMTRIAQEAGFGSLRRFNDAFLRSFGRTPGSLRRPLQRREPQGGDELVLRLAYRPPYDWQQVHGFLEMRALPGVERVDGNGYARTVSLGEEYAIVRVRPLAAQDALELRVSGAPAGAIYRLAATARRVFDLDADPKHIALAFREDSLLAPQVKACRGLRIAGVWDPFECAVRAIAGQQVSVAAGRTLVTRLVHAYGRRVDAEDGLTHLFPAPAALASAPLEQIGMVGARANALRSLAAAVVSGSLNLLAPSEELIRTLMCLPGVGAWTAQYVALRGRGEPNAFPASDLVLRRMAAPPGAEPLTSLELSARAASWQPWRGYATFHLWRAAGTKRHESRHAQAVA